MFYLTIGSPSFCDFNPLCLCVFVPSCHVYVLMLLSIYLRIFLQPAELGGQEFHALILPFQTAFDNGDSFRFVTILY